MTPGNGLVNALQSIVPEEKIVDYLLSLSHPVGRHKAAWFLKVGFRSNMWQQLADSLREHAAAGTIRAEEMTEYGLKTVVAGNIVTPAAGIVPLTSVWIVGEDEIPRFVTAYPA